MNKDRGSTFFTRRRPDRRGRRRLVRQPIVDLRRYLFKRPLGLETVRIYAPTPTSSRSRSQVPAQRTRNERSFPSLLRRFPVAL